MSKWKEVELKEIVNKFYDGPHATPKESTSGGIFLGIKNISDDGRIEYNNLRFIADEDMAKWTKRVLPTEGDIVFSYEATLHKYAIIPKNFYGCLGRRMALIRVNTKKANNYFFYKYLFSPLWINEVERNILTGATVDRIPLTNVPNFKILLPPLPTQQRIASILSAYDDLIENNLKRIKLLEEIAQRTYEEWFVKFRINGVQLEVGENGLPEGWERKSLTSVAEFLNGFAFKPPDWSEIGLPIIKIKEMKNGVGNDTPRNEGGRIPIRYLIKKGDILFSWSASLEVIIWQGVDGWLNQHLFKVTPIEDYPREFVHQALLYCLVEFNNLTTGATMKHIKRQELDFVKVAMPNGNILKQFENHINPIQNQILHLAHQNRLLTESRDILLPRLMSGKVIV